MGGQVRLVHITTLNAAVRVVSSRHCRVGAGILLPGVPAPFVYPLARVLCCRLLLSLLLSCVPLFLLRVGWLCAVSGCRPVFFDSLCARYAQHCIICSRRGGRVRVSRCGIVMWGVLWCVGVSRVWVWGSSGVLLGRERGALVSHLCFSRMLRCPSGAALRGRTLVPPHVIE